MESFFWNLTCMFHMAWFDVMVPEGRFKHPLNVVKVTSASILRQILMSTIRISWNMKQLLYYLMEYSSLYHLDWIRQLRLASLPGVGSGGGRPGGGQRLGGRCSHIHLGMSVFPTRLNTVNNINTSVRLFVNIFCCLWCRKTKQVLTGRSDI